MDWNDFSNIGKFLTGVIVAAFAYLAEIKGAIHVMWVVIAFDLLAGTAASLLKRKERLSMKKFTIALFRALGVTVFVALLFAMDKEMHQKVAASHNIAAWLISGYFLWSFAENMDTLTGDRIFGVLKAYLNKRVHNTTGVDLESAHKPNNNESK